MSDVPLAQKVLTVHRHLAAAGLEHAFGGALALAYYGEPRATKDIDVNVFIAIEERHRLHEALRSIRPSVSPRSDAERDGWETLLWELTPIDVFYAYDPLHQAMRQGTRRQPFLGEPLPFLSAEHLLACKAIFDRPKDWLDIEQVLFALDEFDAAECLRWVVRFVGDHDQRHRRLVSAIAELRG